MGIIDPSDEIIGMEEDDFKGRPWTNKQSMGDMGIVDRVIARFSSYDDLWSKMNDENTAIYVADNYGVRYLIDCRD